MKRILFALAISACLTSGLSSCMNGDYDANPKNYKHRRESPEPSGSGGGNNCFNWGGNRADVRESGRQWLERNTGSYTPPGSGLPAGCRCIGT
jgi:hypothetical protein